MPTTKRVFKHPTTPQADAASFIDAAPYSSGQAPPLASPPKTGVDGQLHVLMSKTDIIALKRAALDRGTTVSDLVRESIKMYIDTE